jgi:hypothetical protein
MPLGQQFWLKGLESSMTEVMQGKKRMKVIRTTDSFDRYRS